MRDGSVPQQPAAAAGAEQILSCSTGVEQNIIRRYDDMEVPLIFSFWFMVAAYVIHVLDEFCWGQLCREGSATLVAGILLDKVLLV